MNKNEWKVHIANNHKGGLSKRAFTRKYKLIYSRKRPFWTYTMI